MQSDRAIISESLQDIIFKIKYINYTMSELANKTDDMNIDELKQRILENSSKMQRLSQHVSDSISESQNNLADFQIEFNDALNHIFNSTNKGLNSLRFKDNSNEKHINIVIILLVFSILLLILTLLALILFCKVKRLQNMINSADDFECEEQY